MASRRLRTIGVRAIRLYPLYHPAAALYTPSTLEVLRADFHRIPELLALGAPEQPELEDGEVPEPAETVQDGDGGSEPGPDLTGEDGDSRSFTSETVQLGLF